MTDDRITQTQPRPNLSTENETDSRDEGTTTQPAPNISTEHQEAGDARRPSDHLDGAQAEPTDDGGRRSSLTDPDAS
ncbi:hypothetical protein [Sphingomonas turrisvirgatae]|uniref:Uncharacterized protein n=1 Tax=Sphingomonas turrisvirgatae TaxID=1888892 RepID=A0A1E3LXY9_9SPHN|nr:hypothetical protein [Sphingomonas turrisvirgatae]ODP38588.1 hypothetical protein BFL28_00665 [Sphingomonas turrisvirgatae]